MTHFTPAQIVEELNRYVIGQHEAKKSVAIALRNRYRRKMIESSIKNEIYPHNILMVGPTGVGKTEIARRLAKIVDAPFIKVEATKFTEIGYVGRDVDSIIRDLMDIAIIRIREKLRAEKLMEAKEIVEQILVDTLVGEGATSNTKEKFKDKLYKGELDDSEVEIELPEAPASNSMPTFDIPGMPGSQMGMINIGDILGKAMGGGARTKKVKMKVKDAYTALLKIESEKLVDEEKVVQNAINAVENDGIVFLDEIDKITSREGNKSADVNREGVQRDLLPLIEGTTVMTKHGPIKTDHILLITSGAFHLAKPSDLLPELQGRLPIRVELKPLSEEDLRRILEEPEHSLPKQYEALLAIENVKIEFTPNSYQRIAHLATMINNNVENIGARRLHSIIEKLFENLNFTATDLAGQTVVINDQYIDENLAGITKEIDLKNFIL